MNDPISSLQNPRVKDAVRLRDRRDRDRSGLFLIEGYRELLRAAAAKEKLQSLFICPEFFLGSNEQSLITQIASTGCSLVYCTEKVFEKLSYRDRPDGLLAIAEQRPQRLADLTLSANPLILIAEAIEKPGNLGTILRSADAAGVDAVIVCDRCTDIYNPNVVRSSTGTLFTVPVIQCTSDEALEWLRTHSIVVAAATPHAEKEFTQTDMSGPIAIAVGTEQLGLTDLWMKQAQIQVRIPMYGTADSLNVATATTLLLYEARRQRN